MGLSGVGRGGWTCGCVATMSKAGEGAMYELQAEREAREELESPDERGRHVEGKAKVPEL